MTRQALQLAAVALALAVAVCVAAEGKGQEEETVRQLIERMARDDFNGLDASRKLAKKGPAAVPALIKATQDPRARVRYWSIAALSSIGTDQAMAAIFKCLDDKSALVRSVAVWHLGGWYGRPEVRRRVLDRLHDDSPSVRGWVLKLILTKKDREAAPQVRELLKAPEPEVRYDALHTLAVLEGQKVLPTLKHVLATDKSPLVRECAVRCCTVIEPPTPLTADVLITALEDKDEGVRDRAASLLRKGFDQYFGFIPSAEPQQRAPLVRQWRQWYERNKSRLRWNKQKRLFELPEPTPAGRD